MNFYGISLISNINFSASDLWIDSGNVLIPSHVYMLHSLEEVIFPSLTKPSKQVLELLNVEMTDLMVIVSYGWCP